MTKVRIVATLGISDASDARVGKKEELAEVEQVAAEVEIEDAETGEGETECIVGGRA